MAKTVMQRDPLTGKIIGLAMEVHRELGPGLLESTYETCLCHEFSLNDLPFRRQVAMPITYKSETLDCGYRADVVVGDKVLLELKSVDRLTPVHEAQIITYLKLSGIPTGLLLNFNQRVLKDGIKRFVV